MIDAPSAAADLDLCAVVVHLALAVEPGPGEESYAGGCLSGNVDAEVLGLAVSTFRAGAGEGLDDSESSAAVVGEGSLAGAAVVGRGSSKTNRDVKLLVGL